ncbi:hypothetical protein ACNHUS_10190 [Actinomycetes bacterium M1A6_2h]
MTRSSVLTSSSVFTDSSVPNGGTASCAVAERRDTLRRSAPVRRPANSRPATGTFEYGPYAPGVSQTEHEQSTRMGIGQVLAIAVTTAVLSLGLIGIANLRADANDVQSPSSTSIVQDELGAAGTG